MQADFVFNASKSVILGAGAVARLGAIVKEQIGQTVLVVTDRGVAGAGLLSPVVDSLSEAGVTAHVFQDVAADPPVEVVLAATGLARQHAVAGVIGLGGGSSMDVAKLVALLVGGGEQLEDIYGVGMAKGRRLPLIQIPTTAGTGSEVTPVSIVTVGAQEKRGVVAPQLLPDVALLDPELTLGLPRHVTAATGIDAMVHAIEAFTSKSANNNPISKLFAREALRLLGTNLQTVVDDGRNVAARSDMLFGSMLAGQAFANSPVAAVHALAYPLGGIYGIAHGVSNAVVLPHVLAFNAPACLDAYGVLAGDVFPDLLQLETGSRVQSFIDRMASLIHSVGLPSRLRELDIPEDALPALAAEAMKQTRLLVNNPRTVSEQDALAIYQAAW
ncbi:iron-containing alcohol dehydrogenase [Paraburkholderia sp. ZP32-5]|uniref:iron-containing alcohol dehydrogenase n=1 Tax=Paraburkholderia sp. ZP32-5 TaxID=2883245 RepID=UPI001F42D275|nr:iron-containing alcohol dehydrogenase [Paraburkholderia sp. ZP32-5]